MPFSVDSAALAGLFETAGNVEMVEELDGRALRVNSGPHPHGGRIHRLAGQERRSGGGGRSFDNTNRVYVGNLAWSVDNVALETLFREQGNVVEAKVVYDRESGRSRGFGFVTFSSADEVNSAVDSLDALS
ncbi:putative RNA recognition motif domain, nucleotide-binding alpha-beta plait domain superfamily [Helianthus annuus]|nr:putative RNA recognition motif domain, nucleotide-binding alpha-beta plait domain superfamily [Helianthus annuus]